MNRLLSLKIEIVLFLLFSFCLGDKVNAAVDPPSLRCASVDVSGVTSLSWMAPVDPLNEFVQYNVFVSATKTGPYTSSSILTIGITTIPDLVNDASLNSYYYFIQTVYDAGAGQVSSASSDTVQTMLPVFVAQTDSTAILEWDALFSHNTPSSSGMYQVYRKIGVGPYVLIGNTTYGNETYSDAFKVCSEMIYYRIDITDSSGCVSSSAIIEDLFVDKTPPATPVYDSITVFDNAGTQQVKMGWQPSTSPDTRGYLVFYWTKSPPSYNFRDTVYTTSYTETIASIDPGFTWEQFTVSAFDSCFTPAANTSPGADDQRTIHLTFIPNNCENTVTLNWTPYINWSDLDAYEIWVSVNGNPFQMGLSVPNTDTTFTYQKLDEYAVYCYKIKAVNSGKSKSSSSNRVCALANSVALPAKQYFKQVSVMDNRDIHIESLTDSTLPASSYVLFRSLERYDNYFEVQRIPFENSSIIKMDDLNANVDQTSYFYRIGVEDTCGSLMFLSKPAASIFLRGSWAEDSSNVVLNWNEYQGWDTVASGVDEYLIYLNIDGNKTEIGAVSSGTTTFSYPLLNDIRLGANFCFEIMAKEADGNFFGQRDSVLSNQVCFTENLKLFVPNAFRPGGDNPVFFPVFSFGDISSYKMIVYDRWGGQVFETTDISQGWNGTVDGGLAPFGAYVYYIEVSNFTGAQLKKRGTFVLLR